MTARARRVALWMGKSAEDLPKILPLAPRQNDLERLEHRQSERVERLVVIELPFVRVADVARLLADDDHEYIGLLADTEPRAVPCSEPDIRRKGDGRERQD